MLSASNELGDNDGFQLDYCFYLKKMVTFVKNILFIKLLKQYKTED